MFAPSKFASVMLLCNLSVMCLRMSIFNKKLIENDYDFIDDVFLNYNFVCLATSLLLFF